MDKMFRPMTKGLQGYKGLMHGDVSKYYTDEWDKDSGRFKLKEGYSHVAHQDAPDALASVTDRRTKKGSGFETSDPQFIYKKVDTPAPVAAAVAEPEPEAPAPEPEKDKGPIEYSPEVAQAKERVAAFKMNGNAGSTFNTEASATTEAATAGTNSISFEPAKIDTPAYNPDAGNEEEAQSFADKYKLNLIEQAVPGS